MKTQYTNILLQTSLKVNTKTKGDKEPMNNRKTAFTGLLRNYEKQADPHTRTGEKEYTTALMELATACTYSVLKKLTDPQGLQGGLKEQEKPEKRIGINNATSRQTVVNRLRREVAHDLQNLRNLEYLSTMAKTVNVTINGEYTTDTNGEYNELLTKLSNTMSNDGLELINSAICAILEETRKIDSFSTGFMEKPYKVRRLKKKVRIQSADSVNGWETVETMPIKEVFKAIRREVEANRGLQIASHKYTYIEEIVTDTETGENTTAYRRLNACSGLAGEVYDFNGKPIAIVADTETIDNYSAFCEGANLTMRERTVLDYRLQGYGNKAIATKTGISENACKGAVQRLRQKAIEWGLNPENI